ncbi:transcription factor bHLH61-like [Mangifera indica]|uniref:transcription factor bHLH61-like n=1 Tax=Mangifera indica TaxID=29780 RepID=UPI001CFBFCFA|nr:transcription factor bHLH61-like [Mangifera indica]
MELSPHGFMEESLGPRRDIWASFPPGISDQFFSSGLNFNSLDENPTLASSNPNSFLGFSSPTQIPTIECNPFVDPQACYSFVDGFTIPEIDSSSYMKNETSTAFPVAEDQHYSSVMENDEFGLLNTHTDHHHHHYKNMEEREQQLNNLEVFNMVSSAEKKNNKSKRQEGQPSKNLMAERRRRKRLNDRLSMLRSIVPKISKMDRTSILGDTIDYMKELLERINKLQEEEPEEGKNQILVANNFKEVRPNEASVRNSPKFEVDRREIDTRIEICCAPKPGLLLSTVSTLEALGLEIQHCVISCFNDFSMQASCSEAAEQRTVITSEDIKQALFRNAGYGGRCL